MTPEIYFKESSFRFLEKEHNHCKTTNFVILNEVKNLMP